MKFSNLRIHDEFEITDIPGNRWVKLDDVMISHVSDGMFNNASPNMDVINVSRLFGRNGVHMKVKVLENGEEDLTSLLPIVNTKKSFEELSIMGKVVLCARAMDLDYTIINEGTPKWRIKDKAAKHNHEYYYPIVVEKQAMAIAKQFMLKIDFFVGSVELPDALYLKEEKASCISYSDESINHAIVDCIAKLELMQPIAERKAKQSTLRI